MNSGFGNYFQKNLVLADVKVAPVSLSIFISIANQIFFSYVIRKKKKSRSK